MESAAFPSYSVHEFLLTSSFLFQDLSTSTILPEFDNKKYTKCNVLSMDQSLQGLILIVIYLFEFGGNMNRIGSNKNRL